ncbi:MULTISPECIES: hypothetical protein [Elizabethkingia]|uniref:Uncharacterized protein n=1 Tax=Elizabethkingia anophelis TaxID=1117645 RepID=A0A455ZCU6_9FLAO|nr:hypothetical protein [Elizabethkingia anophelis]DAC74485.1 TPA_exp: hypothetical protein [Elizabethkingia anophelis]
MNRHHAVSITIAKIKKLAKRNVVKKRKTEQILVPESAEAILVKIRHRTFL